QVSEDGMGKVLPVELFACDFVDGKDMGDLNRVISRWTEFMDESGEDSYAAWILTPYYYGAEQDFDVVWMGASTDGNAMGQGTHRWITEGGDIANGFAQVVDCRAHIGLGSAMYKAPSGEVTPASSIISMMDCEMNDDSRYSDVRSAEIKWAEYMTEQGSPAGTWHWFPNFGGGDQDYDYKVVTAYPSFVEFGKDWEMFANGGGRAASMEIFDDVDDCDDARVYVARSVREAQLR
ncbi:MAG: hypothetical protein AAFX10_17775, partial [Pseudomonadota bacterium]